MIWTSDELSMEARGNEIQDHNREKNTEEGFQDLVPKAGKEENKDKETCERGEEHNIVKEDRGNKLEFDDDAEVNNLKDMQEEKEKEKEEKEEKQDGEGTGEEDEDEWMDDKKRPERNQEKHVKIHENIEIHEASDTNSEGEKSADRPYKQRHIRLVR